MLSKLGMLHAPLRRTPTKRPSLPTRAAHHAHSLLRAGDAALLLRPLLLLLGTEPPQADVRVGDEADRAAGGGEPRARPVGGGVDTEQGREHARTALQRQLCGARLVHAEPPVVSSRDEQLAGHEADRVHGSATARLRLPEGPSAELPQIPQQHSPRAVGAGEQRGGRRDGGGEGGRLVRHAERGELLQRLGVKQPQRAVRQSGGEDAAARSDRKDKRLSVRVAQAAKVDSALCRGEGGEGGARRPVEVPELHRLARAGGEQSLLREHLQPIHLVLSRRLQRRARLAARGIAHADRALRAAGQHVLAVGVPAHAHELGAGQADVPARAAIEGPDRAALLADRRDAERL
mmetsp:Transcript_11283/g.36991  ORF Transcript_11283/g.36991 Transcript_11283/m.36991 type:complete len:348 (+) Transcript_11283:117-1160(+)